MLLSQDERDVNEQSDMSGACPPGWEPLQFIRLVAETLP